MTKPKILFLKGLPASGKSTFARELVSKEPGKWVRLNKDDLRAMLHDGKWSKENEKLVMAMQRTMASDALTRGMSLLIDDTNFNPRHEEDFRQIASAHGADFEVKFFDTPLAECIRRDAARPKPVGAKVIRGMYDQYLWKRPAPPAHVPGAPGALVIDIDGTLARIDHRRQHVAGKARNWPAFFGAMQDDELNAWCAGIASTYREKGYKIVLCSGRPEKYRAVTEEWLARHGVGYDVLLMRADLLAEGEGNDYRADDIVKEEIYERDIKGKYNVLFVIDDRKRVVDMWRRKGLTVLQCDDGDF